VGRKAVRRCQQVPHDDRREAFKGLVEQHQFRIADEGPRDREHLLLAARQRPSRALAALAEAREDLADLLDRPGPGRGQRRETEVLLHGDRFDDPPLVGHELEAAARDLIGRQALDRIAVEVDGAGPRRHDAHDRAHRRGRARAVAAQERHHRSARDGARHVVDGDEPAEATGRRPGFQERRGRHGHAGPSRARAARGAGRPVRCRRSRWRFDPAGTQPARDLVYAAREAAAEQRHEHDEAEAEDELPERPDAVEVLQHFARK
jgi:hypothetical protein